MENMKIMKAIPVFFATFVLIMVSVSCGKSLNSDYSRRYLSNTNAGPVGYDGTLQGFVESEENPTFLKSNNLEDSISSSSLKRLWLVYPSSNNNEESRIEVPIDAMAELNSYLRYRLRFCLTSDQPLNITGKVKKDMALNIESNKVTNRMSNIEINPPGGTRKISQIEADKLVEFIAKSAEDLCRQLRMEK